MRRKNRFVAGCFVAGSMILCAQVSPRTLLEQGRYADAERAAGDDLFVLIRAKVELENTPRPELEGLLERLIASSTPETRGPNLVLRGDARRSLGDAKAVEDYDAARPLCAALSQPCEADAMRGKAAIVYGRGQ